MLYKELNTEKLANKHPLDINKLSADEMDEEIKKGYHDMLADRIVPVKKTFADIRKDYGLEDYHVKEER